MWACQKKNPKETKVKPKGGKSYKKNLCWNNAHVMIIVVIKESGKTYIHTYLGISDKINIDQ